MKNNGMNGRDEIDGINGFGEPTRPGKVTIIDYLIVGAGFAGCVLAERLARGSGSRAG